MGLDQYAYVAAPGQREKYWDEYGQDVKTVSEPREIAYWRKHPNLQGWMERLWVEKGRPGFSGESQEEQWGSDFNGYELELTREDIDRLEADVLAGKLPRTQGFFFGENGDSHYRETDLKFIKEARAELFCGLRVFYNSSW